jgi:two-component system, response regulator / RNA-binding antiterminator
MKIDIHGKALILHRPHATTEAIVRQLTQVGIPAECAWPDLPQGLAAADLGVMFFDADMGHDEQFPWAAGAAPMPSIALIGSEAPGRVAWAIRRGADAHLLKPIAGGGVFSALLIAGEAFARRQTLTTEVEALKRRLGLRESLAEATAILMLNDELNAADAYKSLRRRAMEQRVSIEDMAARVILQAGVASGHGRA